MAVYNNPIVLQRADPWVLKVDGEYYFTGSDPEYNCIAIRHASNINDLQKAPETVVWRKHESGPASIYIWAPELHRINGAWYIYFAGAATDFALDAEQGPTITRNLSESPVKTFAISASRCFLISVARALKGYCSRISVGVGSFLTNSRLIFVLLYLRCTSFLAADRGAFLCAPSQTIYKL